MEITEVRVFLKDGNNKKLKAYATITIDNVFVVRNVKVIEGNKGLFVAMPSRKIKESCPKCGFKNTIRSKFCNQCGSTLPPPGRMMSSDEQAERQSEHKDIAHPISLQCREYIQKKVLDAYEAERKKQPSASAAPVHPARPTQTSAAPETSRTGQTAPETAPEPASEPGRAGQEERKAELEGDLEL